MSETKTGLQRQTKAQLIEIILRKDDVEAKQASRISELEEDAERLLSQIETIKRDTTTKLNTAFTKDMAGMQKQLVQLKHEVTVSESELGLLKKKLKLRKELNIVLGILVIILGISLIV